MHCLVIQLHVHCLIDNESGAQHSETFSSLLPRRKKLISRQIKEQYGFVALSFTSAVDEYGSFRFDQGLLPKDSLVVSVVPPLVEDSPSPGRYSPSR